MPSVNDLTRRVTILEPQTVRDGYGANTPTYSTIATRWAGIESLAGKGLALTSANTNAAVATVRITIRYRAGIRAGFHRIQYKSETYTIIDAKNPGEQNEWLVILCAEVTA
jgi:SPP1 family predicted phage head-tail adaptor